MTTTDEEITHLAREYCRPEDAHDTLQFLADEGQKWDEDPRDAEITRLRAQVSERDALLRRLSEWLMISARVSSAGKKLCEEMNSLSEEIDALLKTEGA